MRIIWAIPLVLWLGGCVAFALPPTLTAASYAADGASLLFSGKSVTDHALSGAADEDCALWRMVQFESPCRPYADPESQIATSDGVSSDVPENSVATSDAPRGREAALPTGEVTITETELAPPPKAVTYAEPPTFTPASPTAAAVSEPRELVFGSFARRANAERLAHAHRDLQAKVVSTKIKGKTYYRVVAAASSMPEAEAMRRKVAAAGVNGAWILPQRQTAQSSVTSGG